MSKASKAAVDAVRAANAAAQKVWEKDMSKA
jgi:hypothetical protein